MDEVTILITAVGGSGHGEQILKAARDSRDLRLRIIGADARRQAHQLEWADVAVQLPHASDPTYMDALLRVCNQHAVQAVFHGSEPEMLRISEQRSMLVDAGIVPIINAADVISVCGDKLRSTEFLAKHGFDPPRAMYFAADDSLDLVDFYPVVVKPFVSSGGSAHVYIAQDAIELHALREYLRNESNLGLMVQEYVGTPESEFTVGVLSRLDGTQVSAVAVRRDLTGSLSVRTRVRNRTGRTDLGPTLVISSGVSQGQIDNYPDVVTFCREVASQLGSQGSINFQCRVDARGVRIFEINPRLSGTTSIRAMASYNEVEYLIRTEVLGETNLPAPEFERCVIERGLTEYRL